MTKRININKTAPQAYKAMMGLEMYLAKRTTKIICESAGII
ncbi:MAG: hypothetical protein RSE50_07370 [Myroides sp.]